MDHGVAFTSVENEITCRVKSAGIRSTARHAGKTLQDYATAYVKFSTG